MFGIDKVIFLTCVPTLLCFLFVRIRDLIESAGAILIYLPRYRFVSFSFIVRALVLNSIGLFSVVCLDPFS